MVASSQLFVPEAAIHTVTDADVVLGTRADWVEAHHWTQPPDDRT